MTGSGSGKASGNGMKRLQPVQRAISDIPREERGLKGKGMILKSLKLFQKTF
jgi:hypothetical protein